MKKRENEKKLEGVFESYESKQDTLFAMSVLRGDDDGSVHFTGIPANLDSLFYNILKKGLLGKALPVEQALAWSMIRAIKQLFDEDSCESDLFISLITSEESSDDDDEMEEFDFHDEGCQLCDDYLSCVEKFLNKRGHGISIVKKHEKK